MAMGDAAYAEALSIAITLQVSHLFSDWLPSNWIQGSAKSRENKQLDKPETYQTLGVIEGEIAKRLMWLLWSSDKDNALLTRGPIRCRFEFGMVPTPAEVDDDWYATSPDAYS
jgi:hypothetical protein